MLRGGRGCGQQEERSNGPRPIDCFGVIWKIASEMLVVMSDDVKSGWMLEEDNSFM